mgnify:CR=1 FL=1
MVESELDFTEQQIDYYTQIINDRYLKGEITKEQHRKYLMKLDQWFKTLDYLWDEIYKS